MTDLSPRHAEIAAAAASLDLDDFTADGRPNVTAINRVLVANGHAELSAEERNEAWDAITIAKQARADVGDANPENVNMGSMDDAIREAIADPAKQDINEAEDDEAAQAAVDANEGATRAGPDGETTVEVDPLENFKDDGADDFQETAIESLVDVDENPDAVVTIKITKASSNPVYLNVNGARRKLSVGKPEQVFRFMLASLDTSDVEYEIVQPKE